MDGSDFEDLALEIATGSKGVKDHGSLDMKLGILRESWDALNSWVGAHTHELACVVEMHHGSAYLIKRAQLPRR